MVTVVDAAGTAVADRTATLTDGHFLGTIPADGAYYAKVLPVWSYNGHTYLLTDSSADLGGGGGVCPGVGRPLGDDQRAAEHEWLQTTFSAVRQPVDWA